MKIRVSFVIEGEQLADGVKLDKELLRISILSRFDKGGSNTKVSELRISKIGEEEVSMKELLHCPECGGTRFFKVKECDYLDSEPTEVRHGTLVRLECADKKCQKAITLVDLVEEIDEGKVLITTPVV